MKAHAVQSDSSQYTPTERDDEAVLAPLSQATRTKRTGRNVDSEDRLDQIADDHAAKEEMSDELVEADEVRRVADLNRD